MANEVRKYWVKAGMRTNLDSMNTSLELIMYDMEDGLYSEVEIMGRKMTMIEVDNFRSEVLDLLQKATWGKVTGREYGRIKRISDERDMWRYQRNVAAGQSEDVLSECFIG